MTVCEIVREETTVEKALRSTPSITLSLWKNDNKWLLIIGGSHSQTLDSRAAMAVLIRMKDISRVHKLPLLVTVLSQYSQWDIPERSYSN